MQIRLADDERARSLEARDDRGVLVGHEVAEDLRARRRPDPARVDVVLDRDGDAVQRAQMIAGADHGLRRLRDLARLLSADGDVSVQRLVDARDALQQGVGELHGRQRRSLDARRRFPDCEVLDVRVSHADS